MALACGRCGESVGQSDQSYVEGIAAPKNMEMGWCSDCIRAVQNGCNVVIPGKSIDKTGAQLTFLFSGIFVSVGVHLAVSGILLLLSWVPFLLSVMFLFEAIGIKGDASLTALGIAHCVLLIAALAGPWILTKPETSRNRFIIVVVYSILTILLGVALGAFTVYRPVGPNDKLSPENESSAPVQAPEESEPVRLPQSEE